MKITATIKTGSTLDKAWRGHNRITAHLGDVVFQKGIGNNPYTAQDLTPKQYAVLKNDPNITFEIFGNPPKSQVQQKPKTPPAKNG